MAQNASIQWVTVATYSTIQEASIAAGMLRDNGIPTSINNATLSSVLPLTDTWTPLELMVPSDKESLALKLLNE